MQGTSLYWQQLYAYLSQSARRRHGRALASAAERPQQREFTRQLKSLRRQQRIRALQARIARAHAEAATLLPPIGPPVRRGGAARRPGIGPN